MTEPDFSDLDFSEFHPLDHSIWQCWDYPGGWYRHLQYRWRYQWSESVHRQTLCWAGFHRYDIWWRAGVEQPPRCIYCNRKEP